MSRDVSDTRNSLHRVLSFAIIASLALCLSSCGEEESAGLGERVIPFGEPVPKGGGHYKVGDPYEFDGIQYTPREDPNYDQTGEASWYGELFHGRYTANGEIYDMDRLSAAHPTLPLPVYVQVTNLANGRSLVVRVNDRGPFKKRRLIDLSRRSAEILGFKRRGTARVRVKYLRRAPMNGDDSYEQQYFASRGYGHYASNDGDGTIKPRGEYEDLADGSVASPPMPDRRPLTIASLLASESPAQFDDRLEAEWQTQFLAGVEAAPETTASIGLPWAPAAGSLERPGGPAIQAASFKDKANAERARVVLSEIAVADVTPTEVGGETYFRVLLGPFIDGIEAAVALSRVKDAGYEGAKIVAAN